MDGTRLRDYGGIVVFLAASLLVGCGGGSGGGGNSFTLSGTITAQANADADGDVNEGTTSPAPVSNDEISTAQDIPNPATVGGYVNVAGFGPPGRSFMAGDRFDVYRVTLTGNQTIKLIVASPANLRLEVFDDQQMLVARSEQPSAPTPTLGISDPGSYFVVVTAVVGASNYILDIGVNPNPAADSQEPSIRHEFVPGEIIVGFKDNFMPAGGAFSMSARAQSMGMTVKGGAPGRAMLFRMDDNKHIAGAQVLSANGEGGSKALDTPDVTQARLETLEAINACRQRVDVEYCEPNYIRRPFLVPNDEFFNLQWGFPLINLPQAWDSTTGERSPPVIVAVIDTGVRLNHPDLQVQLVAGFDFISDPGIANDGDGRDADPNDPGDRTFQNGDGSFHGTHVSGTVAAATNNASGVAGIAWSARIMPLRALGVGGGTDFDIIQAILFAAGLPNDSGTIPSQRADVINMSLGGPGGCASSQAAINDARNAGVILVAAAGNENNSTPNVPAACDGVISVSTVDINKNKAFYSNFGATVDVAAPGGDMGRDFNGDGEPDGVLSTLAVGQGSSVQFGYDFQQGTSMASPHVAGVIALMKALNPNLSPDQFDTLLASGDIIEDLGQAGRDDTFGHGLIDAQAAVFHSGGEPTVPVLSVTPSQLNLGSSATSATLAVSNAGIDPDPGPFTVDPPVITDPAPGVNQWLTVTGPTGPDAANGEGTYTLNVDRNGLLDGPYAATVTFNSPEANNNSVSVTVTMKVGAPSVADAGFHFVLLIDTNGSTVSQQDVPVSSGVYSYSFNGIAAGTYRVVAGTDHDNDGTICDLGEACGVYIPLDRGELNVNGNLSGLDFSSGFDVSLSSARQTFAKQPIMMKGAR
ncbi:MAG: S8 family peptidase [Gammaproteobacteria bacterium]